MMYGVPEERQQEAQRYLKAVQDGLKKVQGAIDLKYGFLLDLRCTPLYACCMLNIYVNAR